MERDFELLRAIVSYRFLYTHQIWWLFPGASTKNLTIRLRYLYHHGYLDRVVLPVSSSRDRLIYTMTEKGAQLLAEHEGIDRNEIKWERYFNSVQPTHIQHLLAINDVLIAYRFALDKAVQGRALKDFRVIRGDPKKHKLTVYLPDQNGRRQPVTVIPDAIIVLLPNQGDIGVCFVEVDRGTMSTGRWLDKVKVYRELPRSDVLYRDYKAKWMILLTVTSSEKRLLSIAQKTVELGGRRGFWFATTGQVTPDTALDEFWVRAVDMFSVRNEQLLKLADYGNSRHISLLDSFEFGSN
jgi:DNA-binding PadR family transcriptional regulator